VVVEQRQQQWIELNRRYGTGIEDWSGLEEYRASQWHRVLHFFQFPFYFIEYGIAQLGALGIWMQAKQDTAEIFADWHSRRWMLLAVFSCPLSDCSSLDCLWRDQNY